MIQTCPIILVSIYKRKLFVTMKCKILIRRRACERQRSGRGLRGSAKKPDAWTTTLTRCFCTYTFRTDQPLSAKYNRRPTQGETCGTKVSCEKRKKNCMALKWQHTPSNTVSSLFPHKYTFPVFFSLFPV